MITRSKCSACLAALMTMASNAFVAAATNKHSAAAPREAQWRLVWSDDFLETLWTVPRGHVVRAASRTGMTPCRTIPVS